MHVMDAPLAAQDNEPGAIVVTPPLRDQIPVLVVQEEKAPQLRPSRLLVEPSVRLSLLITQKFHWHEPTISVPPMIEVPPTNLRATWIAWR